MALGEKQGDGDCDCDCDCSEGNEHEKGNALRCSWIRERPLSATLALTMANVQTIAGYIYIHEGCQPPPHMENLLKVISRRLSHTRGIVCILQSQIHN